MSVIKKKIVFLNCLDYKNFNTYGLYALNNYNILSRAGVGECWRSGSLEMLLLSAIFFIIIIIIYNIRSVYICFRV